MSLAALRLQDIGHAYPGKARMLSDVSLSVPEGRITVVMGANGSGKTTLLRIAAGLTVPQAGTASVADGTPAHLAMRRGRIGYIPQQLGLVRSASVLDNALLGGLHRSGAGSLLGLHRAPIRERALAALELVGMLDRADQPARTLSGGERQRVAIARTLVQEPGIVIADELIASLDEVHARDVMLICRRLRERGVAMLLALHHVDVALEFADEVFFLVSGRLSEAREPALLSAEETRAALLPQASRPAMR